MSQKKQILCEKSYDERVLKDLELEEGDGQGSVYRRWCSRVVFMKRPLLTVSSRLGGCLRPCLLLFHSMRRKQRAKVGLFLCVCYFPFKNYCLVSASTEQPAEQVQPTQTRRMNSSLLSMMPWYTAVLRDCPKFFGRFPVASAMHVSD